MASRATHVRVGVDRPSTVYATEPEPDSDVYRSFVEKFKDSFRVQILEMSDDEIVFDLIGIDAAVANAFRRLLLAEVPSVAIETVFMRNNTSIIQDEVLSHRLGLIPLNIDPATLDYYQPSIGDTPDEFNTIVFELTVQATSAAGESASVDGSEHKGTEAEDGSDFTVVYSSDLRWVPQGGQKEKFVDKPVAPVHDDIVVAKLKPGQTIDLEAHAYKGQGKTHAKWSPVATASYRLMPEIHVDSEAVRDEVADELVGMCPMGVFDIEDLGGGHRTAKATKPRECTMCRECIRHPGWDDRVKLLRKKDHFIFSIESTGAQPAKVLFEEAVNILKDKCEEVMESIAGLDGDAPEEAADGFAEAGSGAGEGDADIEGS